MIVEISNVKVSDLESLLSFVSKMVEILGPFVVDRVGVSYVPNDSTSTRVP